MSRFPDDVQKRLSARKELELTVRWSVGYVMDLQMLDETTRKLLNLCAQEINLIDRVPEYHNPYRQTDNLCFFSGVIILKIFQEFYTIF